MGKRTLLIVTVGALIFWWAVNGHYLWAQSRGEGQGPLVIDAYAAKVIRPGETWMIFLRAEDPNGDMTSIAALLWQAGVGYYPTEVNMLKPEDARQFSGYFSMKTPAGFNINWDELELTLIVRDGQGNRSLPVKLPLTFDMAAPKQDIPQKWQEAANHRLAALMIDLESSMFYNRGGNGDWN
jgi:hypothetical protein